MIPGTNPQSRKFAMRACAAAVCSVCSLTAVAQTAAEQARTAAGQAMIERAQSTGFLAGLDRALKTPLEVIWLRTAVEENMWNEAALSQAVQGCSSSARAHEGCAVVGRTAWRYVFGGNAQFAPKPNEVARLIVSSLKLPETPLTTGKLELSGTGRLYLVTPEASRSPRPATLAVILAAGSSLTISDAAAPAIQIELKAPEHQPLLLGNLATADASRMLALLLKPGTVNASEASISADGRVALRSPGEMQLAALLPNSGRSDTAPIVAIARNDAPASDKPRRPEALPIASLAPVAGLLAPDVEPKAAPARAHDAPAVASEFTTIAAAFAAVAGTPGKRAVDTPMLVASLAPTAPADMGLGATVQPRSAPHAVEAIDEFTKSAAVPKARVQAAQSSLQIASLAPVTVPPAAVVPSRAGAPAKASLPRTSDDFSRVASVIEAPNGTNSAQQSLVASLIPAKSAPTVAIASATPADVSPRAEVRVSDEYTKVAAVMQPRIDPKPAAAVSSAAASSSTTDIARMRAEIEAEIERDRERLAHQRGAGGGKRFVLGV